MPDARPLKAIVCDVDAWNLRVLTTAVTDAGFEVLGEATTAIDAIRLAELLHPTLVLVAQEHVGLSALEVLPDLRAIPDAPEVIVVSIDGDARPTAKSAGAFDLAVKGDTDMLRRQLVEVRELLETGERRNSSDRRSGNERRERQDWSKVTTERRSGTDRRGAYRREKDVTATAKDVFRQTRSPAAS